ncbi:MAG: lysophospholipid acyltransferase family protein [Thermodesulfobacteriota bacterium]
MLRKITDTLRGSAVLILLPILTLLASVIGLTGMLIFRISPRKIQAVPALWGKILLKAGGVRVIVRGLENIKDDRPYIFAANHQSQFDIFAMHAAFPHEFCWLAKKELFRIPLFGQAMRLAGYLPVDRSHGRQAMKSLIEAAKSIAEGSSVIIFPEGTRSPDGRLQRFKGGSTIIAVKSGVPMVPVAISGTHDILPKGKLLARPGTITIKVGKPLDTSGFTMKQKHELADLVHDKVAELLEPEPSVAH